MVGAPAAPTALTAVKLATGSLRLGFTAGANNGAAITSYTVVCTSGNGGTAKSVTVTTSPATVSGLSAGKTYTCTVVAKNSRGSSVASAPSPAVTV